MDVRGEEAHRSQNPGIECSLSMADVVGLRISGNIYILTRKARCPPRHIPVAAKSKC